MNGCVRKLKHEKPLWLDNLTIKDPMDITAHHSGYGLRKVRSVGNIIENQI
jgi:hypothetical protein